MSSQKKSALAYAVCVGMLAFSGSSSATTLFADDFQTNQLSTLWAGAEYPCSKGTSAYITSDPAVQGGSALAFAKGNCWSDIVTTNAISSASGIFVINFDYMHVGQGTGRGTGGGFLGWAAGPNFGSWLQMDSPDYGQTFLSDQWVHVSATFTSSSPINLFIEQWETQSDLPGTSLYKNLVVTDQNGPSANIPEPASLALLVAGLAGLGVARRKQKTA